MRIEAFIYQSEDVMHWFRSVKWF